MDTNYSRLLLWLGRIDCILTTEYKGHRSGDLVYIPIASMFALDEDVDGSKKTSTSYHCHLGELRASGGRNFLTGRCIVHIYYE